MNDRVVIIPTYNEKENIENILRYVFKLEPKFDVLVIEDNSPDGTAQIVKRLQSEFPQLHMIERKGKLGLFNELGLTVVMDPVTLSRFCSP